jgi:alkaline phosphatase D
LGGPLYAEDTQANDLWANSLQALYEYNPIEANSSIYRSQRFGKHLEIFFPDFRSFRSPNADNNLTSRVNMMGEEQLEWLKNGLKESTATWKVISSHDPLGVVTGGAGDYDSYGQEDPAIKGRELELQDLLGFIHDEDITGVISLTSDVHYTAYVNMSPEKAEGGFDGFKPLDEFVIGPIHAGSFGPNYMDTSFGATPVYEMGPLSLGYERWANLSPETSSLQSFGHAAVSEDGIMTIKLMNIDGSVMFEKTLGKSVDESGTTSVSIGDIAEDLNNNDVSVRSESDGSSAHMFTIGAVSIIASVLVVAFV